MPIHNPSQYQLDNMQPGDIVYVKKQKFWYQVYRKLFKTLPKVKVRTYWSPNSNDYSVCYQEDCTIIFYYELACVQTYKNEVPIVIGKNDGATDVTHTILKSLQVGLYNVIMTFKNGQTLTIPVEYFDNAIKKNRVLLKQIDDKRKIDELLKYQRYKGKYFKDYVKVNHIKSWISAYCSVCGKAITFTFKDDGIDILNDCECGEMQLEKTKLTYDEFSIWYYNQLNPNVKHRYDEFWFKKVQK